MQTTSADLVIIGTGAAGVAAALAAQEFAAGIILLNKGESWRAGSTFCNRNRRWGITFADDDREKDGLLNTIQTISHGTNDPALSAILVEEAAAAHRFLEKAGVNFLRQDNGRLQRVPPCFHPQPLAAIIKDTGQCARALERRLDRGVVHYMACTRAREIQLRGRAVSAVVVERPDGLTRIDTPTIILACGGDAALHHPNIVEPGLTGDGHQLLTDLDLPLTNMEYRQQVWEDIDPAAPRFSCAAFFDRQHYFTTAAGQPLALPDPESPVAISRRRHVPISHLQADRQFDEVLLRHLSASPATSAIHVYSQRTGTLVNRIFPHTQACNGGIKIGPHGETGIDGLFAAGELTTGMHGGDRIGGMMIASCLVFGRRAGRAAVKYLSA